MGEFTKDAIDVFDHYSLCCECGSMMFNLLKSHRAKCCECGEIKENITWWHDVDDNQKPPDKPQS